MANAEFDVKSVTDSMEKDNNGCALLFNEAFQLMNKDFDGQMKMLADVEKEALSRPDNILTFEHVHEKSFDPKRNRELAFDGVNIRLPDGKPIFQEIKTSLAADNHTLSIQKTCKPGRGKI